MSNIHYLVLIAALWAIYLIFIFLFKKRINPPPRHTWTMFNDEMIKEYNFERGLKAWKSLGTSKNFPTPKDDSEKKENDK
ncbi:MAG: hypothetical protein MK238_05945 [Nitrospinales bacterium]|nr:hypothetical protein [Nitrospinales bacterium]